MTTWLWRFAMRYWRSRTHSTCACCVKSSTASRWRTWMEANWRNYKYSLIACYRSVVFHYNVFTRNYTYSLIACYRSVVFHYNINYIQYPTCLVLVFLFSDCQAVALPQLGAMASKRAMWHAIVPSLSWSCIFLNYFLNYYCTIEPSEFTMNKLKKLQVCYNLLKQFVPAVQRSCFHTFY